MGAHKYVLSASSPFLKNILLNNPQSHPLIYLKGILHQELDSILQYIYLGEALFYHSNISRFMQAATDLQIKQLSETVIPRNTFTNQEEPVTDDDMERKNYDIFSLDIHVNREEDTGDNNDGKSISSIADELINLDIPAYSPGSAELLTRNQLFNCTECEATYMTRQDLWQHTNSKHKGIVYSCHQCSYNATHLGNLKTHKQAVHAGVKYSCNQCEYQATRQRHLKTHKQAFHEGVKYFCNQCEYQSTQHRSLKTHQQAVHEGVKYVCNQCEYQTTLKSSLKFHINSVHEGVKYCCNQCEYRATTQSHLKKHQQAVHDGVRYFCDQCEFQTGWKTKMKAHKRRKHSLFDSSQ